MEITVGKNLLNIRSEFNLKQHEISGDDISRNLISMIENDKTPLFENVAKVLARNITEEIKHKHPKVFIDPEDLLNPKRYEAKKEADLYVEKIRAAVEKKKELEPSFIEKIDKFLAKWNMLDKSIIIYDLMGDLYYELGDQQKEYTYYTKALENALAYPKMEERFNIVAKLIYNCVENNRNLEVIRLKNLIFSLGDKIPTHIQSSIYYNVGLAHKKLGDFDAALLALKKAKKLAPCKNYGLVFSCALLEANCYREKKQLEDAVTCYNNILSLDIDIDIKALTLANLTSVYISLNNANYIKYLDNIKQLFQAEAQDHNLRTRAIYRTAHNYKILNDYSNASKYYFEALEYAEKYKLANLQKDILKSLCDLYLNTDIQNNYENLTKRIKDLANWSNLELNSDSILALKFILLVSEKESSKKTKEWALKFIENKEGVLDEEY